ncbi:c-type cytochrome [Roseivivax sp. CAU 1753]
MRILPLLVVTIVCIAPSVEAQDVESGAALYAKHCATCHGATAEGGGPMASVLLLQPPDLTDLSERGGGSFPLMRVVTRIDGREPLVSHGSPMPVYGDFFEGVQSVAMKAGSGQPILMSEAVADLVVYLQSLQQ